MKFRKLLVLLLPLMAGCAHERFVHVTGPYPESPLIKRSLMWWTSNSSTNAVNHFYVGAAKPNGGSDALIYWKEERTIIEYRELRQNLPLGSEALAFHHWIKLDQDTVDTVDEIEGSNYVETHRTWVDWMQQCLSRGREYVISLEAAKRLSPKQTIRDDI